MNKNIVLFPTIFLLVTSCYPSKQSTSPPLVSIQIQDRNGLTETISVTERLEAYKELDFLASQPYKKVLRVFKQGGGKHSAKITTYHPNGFVWQYLEAQDMRAFGTYQEWHSNGKLKIQATVIGGTADVTPGSQRDWLFDGIAEVSDEDGNIQAKIPYHNGVMEGTSFYYYPNGAIEKEMPYHDNELEGEVLVFSTEKTLLSKATYRKGKKEGPSIGFWKEAVPAWEEFYQEGRLLKGDYFGENGGKVAQIQNGNGFQAIFEDGKLAKLIEFHQGFPEGKVKRFSPSGEITSQHQIKNGRKQGEEIYYFSKEEREDEKRESLLPKLSIPWENDAISGIVKTWYPNGHLESQREFAKNKKMGPAISWYKDGSLMHMEEYEEDRLIKGQYFKKNQPEPISTIMNGNGISTLYDESGIFLRKVPYQKGKPADPE